MGCCFSNDSSNEELIIPDRPQTDCGTTSIFQIYIVSNDNIVASPSSLQAHNSNYDNAPISTRLSRLKSSQCIVSGGYPSCFVDNTVKSTVASTSTLQTRNSNYCNVPTSRTHSRLKSSQCIVSGGYPSQSLVKTVTSNTVATPSSLQAYNSNYDNAPIITRHSRLKSSQCIVSGGYPTCSVVNTVKSTIASTSTLQTRNSNYCNVPTSRTHSRLKSSQCIVSGGYPSRSLVKTVTSNTVASPSFLQAYNSNYDNAPITTRHSRLKSSQCIVSGVYPTCSVVNTVKSTIASSSALQTLNSNYYNAPTSRTHSRVKNSQCIVSGGYPSCSVVKTVTSTLHKSVLRLTVEWDHMNASSEYELCLLLSGSTEYQKVLSLFKNTTQKHFTVEKIYRIQNPYLLGCYLLKKQEIASRYGYVSEEFLFHGTKEENKDKICKNNFDWRKHGKSVGNIFGQGTSFTPISCYASHYSEKRNTGRMMIVSKVLIAKEITGNKHMKIPPVYDYVRCLRYDTAIKENRQVIVKFSDNEFYPSYVMFYTGQYEKKERKPID